jgi:DNA-binding LytR/AlgR family response regulator
MKSVARRVLIHVAGGRRIPIEPDDVFLLEAVGGQTEVRLRSRTPLVDLRPIGDVAPLFEPFGFVRIHREHAVNLAHVAVVRLQSDGRDWELKLKPPVNAVLPIARERLGALRAAFGVQPE